MGGSNAFGRGLLAGVLAMLGAMAGHWLITPMQHPDAPAWEQVITIAQLLGGFGGAFWIVVRERRHGARQMGAPAVRN